jgi:hypothetical protein
VGDDERRAQGDDDDAPGSAGPRERAAKHERPDMENPEQRPQGEDDGWRTV